MSSHVNCFVLLQITKQFGWHSGTMQVSNHAYIPYKNSMYCFWLKRMTKMYIMESLALKGKNYSCMQQMVSVCKPMEDQLDLPSFEYLVFCGHVAITKWCLPDVDVLWSYYLPQAPYHSRMLWMSWIMSYVSSGHEYVQISWSIHCQNDVTTYMHACYESKVLWGHDTRTRVWRNGTCTVHLFNFPSTRHKP